ncbi:uncharacterized protein EDB93DRAFT_393137 [Suillus bovinus]|uniref:uncharacterized protein n=1 Tax=Suillus bovinus TaxID=48563 RepID=UPI001B8760FF|nr:uncharacterized protein EDB93DRAFT_393137 [Suillus bovinus]KAG2147878.1 hypothetical protein EDB93DRAFT_393137 [Suillus bovinus]
MVCVHITCVFASHPHPFSTDMTIVSNNPAWWLIIHAYPSSFSYWTVATFVIMSYDWALTFGLEVELIWRQRWSLMTVLHLTLRYLGISYAALYIIMLCQGPIISLTDIVSLIIYLVQNWTSSLVFQILCVIIIARLHAMYQGSRKILIFLVVTCLAVNIFVVVVTVLGTLYISRVELTIVSTYQCAFGYTEDVSLLYSVCWMLIIVWEVLVLCLAVWIAVKHLRELRQYSTRGIIEDCFTVLMKTHVLYFASFVAVSCFVLAIYLSPTLSAERDSLETCTLSGWFQISGVVQRFVLGPRLILSVREYHAKLVAGPDAATGTASIAFQERVHISTGSGV